MFLYTMRNKRGIGHVGGDIEANRIDSATVARVSDWIICELIRIFHNLPIEEAQDLVDSLSYRNLPHVWEVAGKKRVLIKGLSKKQRTLLLLYSEPNSFVLAEDLLDWVEYHSLPLFRRDVLKKLHEDMLIEYDSESEIVYLSPLGSKEVEESILGKTI